ncbi:MAG: prepilin-type N-terminal cleavage/methylation domain-containing protein [Cellvibrionaceae bacterium]|nr:prepilin-type N-terminal cleavage/methylation domain-containing protein [Cellvibrionaceae bacterium]
MMRRHSWHRGFSLVELLVVIALLAGVAGLAVPAMGRLYDSMQYRDAARALIVSAKVARFNALNKGRSVDLIIDTRRRTLSIDQQLKREYPETFTLEATTAREVNRENGQAVIRFYSDGSSSGGDVRLAHDSGRGLQLRVEWLFSRISQHGLDEELL